MTSLYRLSLGLLLVWLSPPLASANWDDTFFESRIRPVLIEKCLPCHSEKHAESGLRVGSLANLLAGGDSGPAINLSHPDQSLLLKAISSDPDVAAMPPQQINRLRTDQIQDFQRWLDEGANWPAAQPNLADAPLWSLIPPVATPLPTPDDSAWAHHPIDRFIRAKQEALAIHPGPQADRRSLLRRASYDLTGLPPTFEEILAFEQDPSDDAFAKCIDRLLDSPAYGERWGRHWLDVVRYADTAGETADYPVPTARKYRDYVIQSFQNDKPYDQFLREQIAGDILANHAPTPEAFAEQTIATGFLAISRRFGFDSENYHHLTIEDTIHTLGQSLLGLSLGCARCHDHKFDPVPMRDYYALYGIFDSSRYPFPGSEQKQRTRCLAPLVPPAQSQPRFRAFDTHVATTAAQLSALNLPAPQATLRSLHDLDGDFELQAPAAGGSNGVLVSPWLYHGPIEVTTSAQSPFLHLYPRGKVGVHIPSTLQPYRIEQALHAPASLHADPSSPHPLAFNFDWRLDTPCNATGKHRLWLGTNDATLIEFHLDATSLQVHTDAAPTLATPISIPVRLGQWYSLQLHIDYTSRAMHGSLNDGQHSHPFDLPLPPNAPRFPERFRLESLITAHDRNPLPHPSEATSPSSHTPGLEFDNVSLQLEPLPSPSLQPSTTPVLAELASLTLLQNERKQLVGADPTFEFQLENQPPTEPWGPGPNSQVLIHRNATSPFSDLFPPGTLGLHMPNRAEYDGFGQTLNPLLHADSTKQVFVTFDFSCAHPNQVGPGTWRFYIGHGPGPSPAVELFFHASQFFQRSGNDFEAVAPLEVDKWYRVQLAIDLHNRTYRGTLGTPQAQHSFSGKLADAWDGTIDYTFIDSYGHLPGIRPELRIDNFAIRTSPFEPPSPTSLDLAKSTLQFELARAHELRQLIEEGHERAKTLQSQLAGWLRDGPVPMAYAMAEGTPHAVRMQLRGQPDQLGEEIPRGFLTAWDDSHQGESFSGSGRLELANWIANRNNPLTARVMVNRLWLGHFGEGIVKTPNDFGRRGTPPTHPELLDFLATYFADHHWSIRQMHRLIMTSQSYQRSTLSSATQLNPQPPDSDTYDHFRRRRLTAEEIRDSILAVSDGLDRSPAHEHPFPSPTSWGFTQHAPFLATYDHQQRSIYLMTQRIQRHPFLALFDGADPNASTPKRNSTIVPTQALYFLNDPLVHQASHRIAHKICQPSLPPPDRVVTLYRQILARDPDPQEVDDALQLIDAYSQALHANQLTPPDRSTEIEAWSACARTLLGSNEFLYVE